MACRKCGEPTVRTAMSLHEQVFENRIYTARLPCGRCSSCGEVSIDCEALAAFELDVARDVAEHGPVSGETLAYMRKAMQLDAKALAKMLDVSAGTLSRWENGVRKVHFAAWFVTGDLVLERAGRAPPASERLASVIVKSTRTVRIRVEVDPAAYALRSAAGR